MKRITTESKIVLALIVAAFVIGGVAFALTGTSCSASTENSAQNTSSERSISTIDTQQAQEIQDLTIVDVRSEQEYTEEHIKDAINLNIDTLNDRTAGDALPDKDAPIAVYCYSGGRAAKAYLTLVDLGYTNVYDLGKLDDWAGEKVSGE